ncbi:MAG: MerR family transcriptional regulator, partial [Thermoleophilia bacterium]|nr:MerR family transcriptional regulator [Thermoleophilia bacterium]
PMSTMATRRRDRGAGAEGPLRTIGAVCEELRAEFPDISVSKIRYLEDQGLLAPRRTRGGYRLFSPEDVARLATILRLQRDEFLPLRVIREALDGPGALSERGKRRPIGLTGREEEMTAAEVCERASVTPDFLRELEEYGIVRSRSDAGERRYLESEADIAAACARLARYGLAARHLRAFVTAAARHAVLVGQLVAPGLRSRNPERRKAALEDLEHLARSAHELSHHLLLRELRASVRRPT